MSDSAAATAANPPGEQRPPHRLRNVLLALLAILAIGVAIFLLLPSPIDAVAYDPPPAPPLTGPLAPNTKLRDAVPLADGQIAGPEDVEVDPDGVVYTGLIDGRIVRILDDAEGGRVEEFVNTGGRPLGMVFDRERNLIVADALKGILAVDPAGQIATLATEADGVPLGFPDDLDVAGDGTVYFSDASTRFGNGEYLYDMLEARPWGRLIAHNRATGETKTLVKDLYFANGVALSQHEDFVLVNETYRYRVKRYWLKGDKAGTVDTFIDNLPGFPDNISRAPDGGFWLALFTVRNPELDSLSPHPWLKDQLAKLPKPLWPAPAPYGFVVKLDESGQIVTSLQDPGGERFREITSPREHAGKLYLGSLSAKRVGRYQLEP